MHCLAHALAHAHVRAPSPSAARPQDLWPVAGGWSVDGMMIALTRLPMYAHTKNRRGNASFLPLFFCSFYYRPLAAAVALPLSCRRCPVYLSLVTVLLSAAYHSAFL